MFQFKFLEGIYNKATIPYGLILSKSAEYSYLAIFNDTEMGRIFNPQKSVKFDRVFLNCGYINSYSYSNIQY